MEKSVTSIIEALKLNAQKTPDKLCVGDKKNHATYGEFWTMVERAATWLREKGVKKGDMVVIRGAQKVEFVLGVFAVQLVGGAVCPLEKAIKDDRIMEIMDFVDSNIYLADKPVKNEQVNNISLKELFKAVRDEENPIRPLAFEFPKEDDLSEILFTTGTTGKSKGIEVTCGCNIAIAQNVMDSVQTFSYTHLGFFFHLIFTFPYLEPLVLPEAFTAFTLVGVISNTRTFLVNLIPLSVVAVMVDIPTFLAVMVPFWSTETTEGLLLVQVMISVVSAGAMVVV